VTKLFKYNDRSQLTCVTKLFIHIVSKNMSSAAITTIIQMVEALPDNLQEQVADHLRAYIADLEEEARWESSFQRTQSNLVAAARRAKQEIADGQAVPMDYEQL
jgi:translation initiation factor 2B subunit (eIF-2B alpha/beta/delta family)